MRVSTLKAQQCRFEMISTVRLVENDNSEPSDIVLPIGHLLGSNGVKGGFYRKSSKTSI